MSERNHLKDLRNWENGHKKWDFGEETYKANKEMMDGFGRDPFGYDPENRMTQNMYWKQMEGPVSHGYPQTAWLQIGLVYGCGIYTAHNQGIIRTG